MEIIREYMAGLPVLEIAEAVNESLARVPRLVVTAPPGSGKSTLLPLTIASALERNGAASPALDRNGAASSAGKVVMLEPRRAAARQIAARMAQMLGEKPGLTVGYRMRFEQCVSEATRVEVVTEGIMERMLTDDPTLEGIDAVIFDEFHERSLASDLSLALTLEAQRQLRPELKVVIMSATVDAEPLCRALDAPLAEASGKMFDVTTLHGEDTDMRECADTVAAAVRKAWREGGGSILAFLPGRGEIMRCADTLRETLPQAPVYPLYGDMPASEQMRAISPMPGGGRRVVLATPIAETSLTIADVDTVVDSGLCRAVRYDPATGLSRLVTERISLDMADQRRGRAGRTAEGRCLRLWSKAAEHRMTPCRQPEITEADLSAMTLAIAAWGGAPAENLPWLTPPPPGHLAEARRLLRLLGAIDSDGLITPLGRRMNTLPCHPRIANMLVTASTPSLRALAADIAALLEEKDPVDDPADADINTRIAFLRDARRRRKTEGRWSRIARIAAQYRHLLRCQEENTPADPYDTGALLTSAYPERIARRSGDGKYRMAGGAEVLLSEEDDLSGCEYLAVASAGKRIFLASPVKRETLTTKALRRESVSWDARQGRVAAVAELRLGVLIIDSRPLDNASPEEIAQAVAAAAVKHGHSIFDFSDEVTRLQCRLRTVASWHPELNIPDVSDEALLARAAEWLPIWIGCASTQQELRRIDLCKVIWGMLDYDVQQAVERIAPARLSLPRGRSARIDYRPGSELPVVSARIEDVLGMHETPRLDGGERPVLMELLSPGYKPVQLTRDLRGFWSGTYFEVRKELRRRYPKHPWPEDPLKES